MFEQKKTSWLTIKAFAFFAGIFLLVLGFSFALSARPVAAVPLAQTAYPVGTVSVTPTVTATTGGTAAATSTVTVTVTATRGATLAPPATTGTPTVLVPVTGADLYPSGGMPSLGVWMALWLLGLLLIVYGLRARQNKG